MKIQEIFTVHPHTSEQVDALKAFMRALNIKFEITKKDKYTSDFVEKILESNEQAKSGKVTRVKKENLKEFLDM